MEKTKKVIKLTITICILGFTTYFCKCKKVIVVNDDCATIDYADSCLKIFNEQNLHQIIARNNYYYCSYKNNSPSYIVPNNYQYIREIGNDTMITIFKENMARQPNGDSLIMLLHIVESLHQHDVSEIEVNADTIKLSKFNGYYLTNRGSQYNSSLRHIKDGWYKNE